MKRLINKQQKEIADKALILLKEGLWSKKEFKFNREEIYEERIKSLLKNSLFTS